MYADASMRTIAARSARLPSRARIETRLTRRSPSTGLTVAPDYQVGRGLKPYGDHDADRRIDVAPDYQVGRGLKHRCSSLHQLTAEVAPDYQVGRGLKRLSRIDAYSARGRSARLPSRARIETVMVPCSASVAADVAPDYQVGRGLKRCRALAIDAKRRVAPDYQVGRGLKHRTDCGSLSSLT